MNNSVAIIVPTYNSANYIEQTMSSVMRAVSISGNVSKVYVTDDASKDGTVDRVRACWESTVALEINARVSNVGECINVNDAFQKMESEGVEWALLLHADDQIHPQWPAIAFKLAQEAGCDCGMACCQNIYNTCEQDVKTAVHGENVTEQFWLPGNLESIDRLGNGWFWPVTGSLIRVSAYNRIGGFHPEVRYAGDNDFIVRFFLGRYGVSYTGHPFIFKRNHAGSVTSSQIRSGEYAIGWSHLMHRYSWLTSTNERFFNFLRQMMLAFRLLISAFRSGDLICFKGQIRALWIFSRSLVALLSGWKSLNPPAVRLQLARRFPYQDDNRIKQNI